MVLIRSLNPQTPPFTSSFEVSSTFHSSSFLEGSHSSLLRSSGTGLKLYGHSADDGGELWLRFDGTGYSNGPFEIVKMNETMYAKGGTFMFEVQGQLAEADHELWGMAVGKSWVDYIELRLFLLPLHHVLTFGASQHSQT